ncbi:MAG: histidine--tRNA ligase [Candidatus Aenigmarchaeota archaeon]|nr:histidine--tRNA ligase [Candidatus Aenigmarchaeota archaeon]
MSKFQSPKGTRDFLPEEMIKRQYIIDTVRNIFERFGFQPLETPAFESWELLSAKGGGGEAIKNEIYYFKDKGDRELGLRFDLTVPLARVIASNPQLPKPFKRYQIQQVWRYDNPQSGRYREFWQADVDIVGSASMDCEAECLAVAGSVLMNLGFNEYSIRLNNRKILNILLSFAGVEKDDEPAVFRILDKFEKAGREETLKELGRVIGERKASDILGFIDLKGRPEELIEKIRKKLGGLSEADEGIKELEGIAEKAKAYGIRNISIDLSLVRGLDYYTGPIFEISIKAKKNVGSVAGGGRYDSLVALYGGQPTPCAGFSFGIDRLYDIMESEGMLDMSKIKTKVLVASVNESLRNDAIGIARNLRENGINAETDLMGRPLRKQLDYANSAGMPYVIVVGEKEMKENAFHLKDMKTGKEERMNLESIIKRLKMQEG